MMKRYSIGLFWSLSLLIAGTVFAGELPRLPNVALTAAAFTKAKLMLQAEADERAVLTMIKGNFELREESGLVKEKRSGWMLQVVNREQFPDEPRKHIDGLEILLPQEHLYGELEGATLDYSNGWWVLEPQQ